MKRCFALAITLLCASLCWGQLLTTQSAVSGVWAVTNGKQIIQYDIGFIPGGWLPTQKSQVYEFAKIQGFVQFITVGHDTRFWANSFQNLCGGGNGCTYSGRVIGRLQQERVELPDGSLAIHVSGTLRGKFTDAQGIAYQNVCGRVFFETNPASSIRSVMQMTPGQIVVELLPE